MLKEHIVETLGEIRYTLSNGASGGSILQHLVANAYPGLLDGIQPSATLQDLWTTNTEAQDCGLLVRYFNSTSPGPARCRAAERHGQLEYPVAFCRALKPRYVAAA
jgi:hypothetical protein